MSTIKKEITSIKMLTMLKPDGYCVILGDDGDCHLMIMMIHDRDANSANSAFLISCLFLFHTRSLAIHTLIPFHSPLPPFHSPPLSPPSYSQCCSSSEFYSITILFYSILMKSLILWTHILVNESLNKKARKPCLTLLLIDLFFLIDKLCVILT